MLLFIQAFLNMLIRIAMPTYYYVYFSDEYSFHCIAYSGRQMIFSCDTNYIKSTIFKVL